MRKAELPEEPVNPVPWATIILAGLGGFLLPPVVVGLYGLVARALRPRELEDPLFGRIRFDRQGLWRGAVRLDTPGPIDVSIHTDKRGPTDADRRAFVELSDRYGELKPSISEKLFAVYEHVRENASSLELPKRPPELSEPQEVWDHARLSAVSITTAQDSAAPQLVLAYAYDWDDELYVRVFIWDWRVVRAALER